MSKSFSTSSKPRIRRKPGEGKKELPKDKRCIPVEEKCLHAPGFVETSVHDVYDQIAPHFSHTRYKQWPKVAAFLDSFPLGSFVLDAGCGNGKYLDSSPSFEHNEAPKQRKTWRIGFDRSFELLKIATSRSQSDCFVSDVLQSCYRPSLFDGVISIAVIHHLPSESSRLQALRCMRDAVKVGGRVLVYVWAMEQECGTVGAREFETQDVFVPWHMQVKHMEKENSSERPAKSPRKSEEDKTETKKDQDSERHSADLLMTANSPSDLNPPENSKDLGLSRKSTVEETVNPSDRSTVPPTCSPSVDPGFLIVHAGSNGEEARLPMSVSIPRTETKSGLISSFTCYHIEVFEFGLREPVRSIHRYDDFIALHASLLTLEPKLPPLPPKQMFGGTDPRVVEERRPALEKFLRASLSSPRVLLGHSNELYEFLQLSKGCAIASRFLGCGEGTSCVAHLAKLMDPSFKDDQFRLGEEQVMRRLLHMLSHTGRIVIGEESKDTPGETQGTLSSVLEVLHFVLSNKNTGDARKNFVKLRGLRRLLELLVKAVKNEKQKKPGEPAIAGGSYSQRLRKVLNALVTAEGAFFGPHVLLPFFEEQDGIRLLLEGVVREESAGPCLLEFTARLLWLGLDGAVKKVLYERGEQLLQELMGRGEPTVKLLTGLILTSLLAAFGQAETGGGVEDLWHLYSKMSGLQPYSVHPDVLGGMVKPQAICLGRLRDVLSSGLTSSPVAAGFITWFLLEANIPPLPLRQSGIIEEAERLLLADEGGVLMDIRGLLCRLVFKGREHNPLPASLEAAVEVEKVLREGLQMEFTAMNYRIDSFLDEHLRGEVEKLEGLGLVRNQVCGRLEHSCTLLDKVGNRLAQHRAACSSLSSTVSSASKALEEASSSYSFPPSDNCGKAWKELDAGPVEEWSENATAVKSSEGLLVELQDQISQSKVEGKAKEKHVAKISSAVANVRKDLLEAEEGLDETRRQQTLMRTQGREEEADKMLKRGEHFMALRDSRRVYQAKLEEELEKASAEAAEASSTLEFLKRRLADATKKGEAATMSRRRVVEAAEKVLDESHHDWLLRLQPALDRENQVRAASHASAVAQLKMDKEATSRGALIEAIRNLRENLGEVEEMLLGIE